MNSIELIIEKLKSNQNRDSTAKNYISIWRHFNAFLIRLDYKPKFWEHCVSLFCAYLIDAHHIQSSTLHLYISAIKHTLKLDGYKWKEECVWLDTLVKSCKIVNDCQRTRLPIQFGMLELLMFELRRMMDTQPYLEMLYTAMFCLAYYGLMRVSEISKGKHNVHARNIHIAQNKEKILILLYSSKTKSSEPQQIKISGTEASGKNHKFFCPFKALQTYINVRGHLLQEDEPFFVYSNRAPVPAANLRKVLRSLIQNLNLDPLLYNFQSLRIGRATDLMKFGYTVEQIKCMGRWRSSAVFKY